MWTNPGELPGNGLDDDGNGFVDDVHGADTVGYDGDPSDGLGHGTAVASVIASFVGFGFLAVAFWLRCANVSVSG